MPASLAVGSTTSVLMGINFNDTTQPAGFQLTTEQKSFPISIAAPVGELLKPHTMSEGEFKSHQGLYLAMKYFFHGSAIGALF